MGDQQHTSSQQDQGVQGSTFNAPATVNFGTHSVPTPEQAQALLDQLPTEHVPEHGPPLAAISRLTLLANPQFVGRVAALRQLAAQLKAGATVAITTGVGGVGKTQLASVFAARYGGYFAGGVFWLSFAEAANIPAEIAACGQRGLVTRPGYADLKQDDQVELVQAAWQQPIPRLLIFDNCEDQALLHQWLPRLGGCRVLVTSRRHSTWDAVLKVWTLPLEVLPRADSVALLQQLASELTVEQAEQIAAALGDLPLALHLAGCYLAHYHTPAEQYLDKLATLRLVPHPSLQGEAVERQPNVEQAFALSLARLDAGEPTDNLARQLLARAACFAPGEPFGRSWLEANVTPEGNQEEQVPARADAAERLLGLGLLERVGEGEVRLHRLLAVYVALALDSADALPAVEWVVSRVAKQANTTKLPAVLPHLRHLVQRSQGREDERVASLCINLGFCLNTVGAYAEALPLYERALPIMERVLGADHPATATNLSTMAVLHANQGQFAQALPLQERVIAIRQARLGPTHPDTVLAQGNLAALRRHATIATLPPALRAALQADDGDALAQALQALPDQEAQAIVQRLQAAGVLGDPQEQFMPFLRAVVAVAQGDDTLRAKVEQYLAYMESKGFHLTPAVQAIWADQRDPATLTAGLNGTDAELVQRVLALLEPGAG